MEDKKGGKSGVANGRLRGRGRREMYWRAGCVGGGLDRHPTGLTAEFLLLVMLVMVEGGLLLEGGGGGRRRQGQSLRRRQSRGPRVEAAVDAAKRGVRGVPGGGLGVEPSIRFFKLSRQTPFRPDRRVSHMLRH